MKVQRILHIRVRRYSFMDPDMKGGATVLLDGDTESTYIKLRVAHCHPDDVFCKAKGRQYAENAEIEVVNLRSLPGVLGKIQREVHKRSHFPAYTKTNYDNKIRDFLPKE